MIAPFTKSAVLEILRTPAASDTFPDMIRRVEALEGSGVRIKALKWLDGYRPASTPHLYQIWPDNGGSGAPDDPLEIFDGFMLYSPNMMALGVHQTIESAKAAAQADYEARIMAALEPVAQPEPGPSSPYAGLSGIWSSSIYADHSAPDLTDQTAVHLNMLRGTIAKPTVDQIIHIYGVDVLCKALAPRIVREAVSGGNPMWCDGCRSTGAVHCAHPDECGNMLSATGAADQWKSWLDDLPLPFTFDSAIGRLQDFITALTTLVDVPQPHPPREPGAEPTPAQFELMCLAIEDAIAEVAKLRNPEQHGYVKVIDVEKLLCDKLGIQWSATGISIASMIDRLAAENQRLRDRERVLVGALINRDGGSHDEDCKARRYGNSDRPCNCGHDEVVAALATDASAKAGGE